MPAAVQNVSPSTDQENVPPTDPVANVRNAAVEAMAMHIDGSAKASKNGTRRERLSNAEKIEDVFSSIDDLDAILSLVDDV